MKTDRLLALLTATLLLNVLTLHLQAADAPTVDDLNSLQGKWTIESVIKDGQEIPRAAGGQMIFVEAKVTIIPKDAPMGFDMTVTLDSLTSPKTISFHPIQSGAKSGLGNGAYDLSGGTLRLAFATKPNLRDKTPTSVSDKGQLLYVLKRGELKTEPLTVLQGKWEGVEVGREAEGKCTMTVAGNAIHFQGSNKNEWYKTTFTLPAGTDPKQLHATITECPAPDFVGRSSFSIYKLEEGKLTLVGHRPGAPDAPKSFEGDAESRTFVFEPTQHQ